LLIDDQPFIDGLRLAFINADDDPLKFKVASNVYLNQQVLTK